MKTTKKKNKRKTNDDGQPQATKKTKMTISILKSVFEAADLPELFLALPADFTFPLARVVMDYAGASNAFDIAMWRIHPTISPPPWMAEFFHDWAWNVFPYDFPSDRLSKPSKTADLYGPLLSIYAPTAPLSSDWKEAFCYFANWILNTDITGDASSFGRLLRLLYVSSSLGKKQEVNSRRDWYDKVLFLELLPYFQPTPHHIIHSYIFI